MRNGQYFVEIKDIDTLQEDVSVSFVKADGELKTWVPVNKAGGLQRVRVSDVMQGSVSRRKVYRELLDGAGSILNISPDVDYRDFVPKQSATERMRGHFENTGRYIYIEPFEK